MSAYVNISTKFRYLQELVEALEEIYGKNHVEVHKEAANLYGYMGDKRQQKANIVVRRKHIGSSSNDLGFVAVDDHFEMMVSQYDQGHTVKISNLVKTYTEKVIKNKFPRGKYRIVKKEDNRMKVQVMG